MFPWLATGGQTQVRMSISEPVDCRRGLKTFRATFAQNAKDNGASIEAVSRAMRHRTTKTTEAYYARIRADSAFAEIERAFERPVKVR